MADLVKLFIDTVVLVKNPNLYLDARFRVELKGVNSQTSLGLEVNPEYPWIISKIVPNSLLSQKGIIAGDVLLSVGTNRNVDEHAQIKSTHTTSDILGFIEAAKKSGQVVLRFAPRFPNNVMLTIILKSIKYFMIQEDKSHNMRTKTRVSTRLKGASLVVIHGLSSPLGITMDKYDTFWIVQQSTNSQIQVGDVIKKVNEDPITKNTDLSRYKNYSLTLVRNMNTQFGSGVLINTNEDLGVTFKIIRRTETTPMLIPIPTGYYPVSKYVINTVTKGGIGDLFDLKEGYELDKIDGTYRSDIPGIFTEKNTYEKIQMLDAQKIQILENFIRAKQEECRKSGKVLQFNFLVAKRSIRRNNLRTYNSGWLIGNMYGPTFFNAKPEEEDPKSAIRGKAGGKRKSICRRRKNSSAKTRKVSKGKTPAKTRKRAGHKKASRRK
jgi:hypothetical protein